MDKNEDENKPPEWLHWLGYTWKDIKSKILLGIIILVAFTLFICFIDSLGLIGIILMILVLLFL